ncbi:MAG: ABC transporter ATP-binding protein/permease [Porticoccaceae bacterium]|jgi:ATP-binding cassette subfamily B protein|nr:ABC transporter ATP-binding protein/permease [Porticoccaceae bacterium]MBT3799449.1 ABC transporter ATP-binding protein/permease [Porticoccaceae bacterium]MBT4164343.1 ABC transporter ATP-binding protein/permease [Porticoccaceae bacterium]MBT4592127.1 ABC transporter ATP-binding protein/permease [Porticoccaceae bacterium]MBT5002969.1 ABC transporter ATP-binding protein/permease [Porticoccaceae bacterium]
MRSNDYPDNAEQKINWKVFRFVWPYLIEYKSRIAFAFGCLMLSKAASVSGPFLLKNIVDTLSEKGVNGLILVPVGLVLAYGFARFSMILLGEIRDTVFGRVTERAMSKIGLKIFKHVHSLDLDFHLNRRTGGLSRDIERGINGISFLMRFFVFNIAPTLIEILLVIGLLFFNYGVAFAAITMLAVVIYIVFSMMTTDWRTKFVREAARADSASSTISIDSLLNYETVKYFTNEEYEANRYDKSLADWEEAKRRNRLSLLGLNAGQGFIISAAMTSMMWLAAERVVQGSMTLGDFVLINAFMMQIFIPLNFLGFVYREIKGSMANIENMFALLDLSSGVEDIAGAPELVITQGAISFNDVSFHYREDRAIIKNLSFTIQAGEKVAIVGASGAGKSTLVKLLFRFYDPNAGSIFIDGQDLSRVSQQSLRNAIGIVPQDTVLFNQSIFENIRYGNPQAADEEVLQAIRLAHLDGFIAQLPQGSDTLVGERGLKLSGGEKQRVAIARTILKRPPILVFDEATSSLDSKSERSILSALQEISQGHTSMVIAHRLSTVIDSDRIVVLDRGSMVEQGSHRQLLARKGHYFELWTAQLRNHS